MFKKLFISLLILTTLSSEGIVNFPVNIYNFYMNTANGVDLQASQDEAAAQLQQAKNYDAISQSLVSDLLYKLTLNSIQKFQSKDFPLEFNQVYKPDDSLISININFLPHLYSCQIILHMSDNSPPLINV